MSDKLPGIRPRLSLAHRLDVAARHGFPVASTLIAVIVLSAPFGLPGQPQLRDAVILCSVYFWSLFRPASMPAPLVFLLGLIADLLGGAPLASTALLLLSVHAVALTFRFSLTRRGFVSVWLSFIAIAACVHLLAYVLASIMSWNIFSPLPALFGFVVSVGLYPNLAVLLTWAHRGIAAPEKA